MRANFRRMLIALPTGAVVADAIQSIDAQLFCQRMQHRPRYRHRIIQEGAQVAHGAELYGEAKPAVLAAFLRDQRMIGIVQVEVTSQIVGRWCTGVAAVVLTLFAGQEADWHRAFLRVKPWRDGAPRSA